VKKTAKRDITLVYGEDWIGVYADGELLRQNHDVSVGEFCEALGWKVKHVAADPEWLERNGTLPQKLREVKKEKPSGISAFAQMLGLE
jgi:hypothetical protein